MLTSSENLRIAATIQTNKQKHRANRSCQSACWSLLHIDEVPDPYYGGEDGFDQVLDILEEAIEALYEDIS